MPSSFCSVSSSPNYFFCRLCKQKGGTKSNEMGRHEISQRGEKKLVKVMTTMMRLKKFWGVTSRCWWYCYCCILLVHLRITATAAVVIVVVVVVVLEVEEATEVFFLFFQHPLHTEYIHPYIPPFIYQPIHQSLVHPSTRHPLSPPFYPSTQNKNIHFTSFLSDPQQRKQY